MYYPLYTDTVSKQMLRSINSLIFCLLV